ncbi:hypothetical protein NUSPORA_02067 [Nucleospora cyclopteri]
MIQTVRTKILNSHVIQEISKKTQLTPETIVGLTIILLTIILDTTFVGTTLNNLVCLFLPIQETIMVLKSPNPNVKEMRKCLLILFCFSLLATMEPLLKGYVPFYSIFKLIFLISASLKPSLQMVIQTNFIDAIPASFFGCEQSSIKTAVKAAEEKAAEAAKKISESQKNK